MLIKCQMCDKTVEISENLSDSQKKVLKFIINFMKEHKKSPSYREISQGLGYKTTSIVHHHIDGLIYKQYVTRRPYYARSLVVLKELCDG